MTRYFTQWGEDGQVIGTNVAGWTVRGGGAPGRAPKYGTPAVQRRYLNFVTDNTGDYRCVSWDAIDADANRAKANPVTCFKVDDTTVEEIHIYVRGQGSGTVTDFYRVRLKMTGASNLNIDKMVASAYTAALGSATVTLSAGKSYFVRMDANGTALKARVWDAALGMAGEPTTWDVSVTDSSVTAAGWVGLGARHSTTTGSVAPFNFFAVGTNGDSAVCPRTNVEFLKWLGQRKKRCIVAILQATGYDSTGSPYTKTVKAYLSNTGFTSQQQDTPASKHFPALIKSLPTFSREMNSALTGRTSIGFGDLVVRNNAREAVQRWLSLPGIAGNYASTPDASANSITGDIEFRVVEALADWTPSVVSDIVSKSTTDSSNFSWVLRVDTGGTLTLYWSADGTTLKSATSTAALTVSNGQKLSFACTLDVDNGAAGQDVKFYVSADYDADKLTGTWTQLGATVTVATAGTVFDSTAALKIGARNTAGNGGMVNGNVYRVQIFNGIGAAAPAVDFDPRRFTKRGTTAAMTTGETWTVNTSGATPAYIDETRATPAPLDDWLRMSWNRSTVQLLLGDESWPLHDFRPLLVGRLGQPTAPTMDTIKFELGDMLDALNAPIQPSKFTSGDYNKQYKPTAVGFLAGDSCCVPPKTDPATLTFTLASEEIAASFGPNPFDMNVRDNGVRVVSEARVVTAVNAGTDTLTSVGHGLKADATVRFYSGTPPAPLALNTDYFVIAAGLTVDDFRLSATLGGAAINITGAAGGTFEGYLWVLDKAAATMTLLSPEAGVVTVSGFSDGSGVDFYEPGYLDMMYSRAMFSLGAISLNLKDAAAFEDLRYLCEQNGLYGGLWIDTELATVADVADGIAARTGTWYGASFDGLLQAGLVYVAGMSLPATPPTRKSFSAANVSQNSLKFTGVRRAGNYANTLFSYRPMYGAGQVPSSDSYWQQRKRIYTSGSVSYGNGVPLDNYPNNRDAETNEAIDTIYQDDGAIANFRNHIVQVHKKPLGFYEFSTTLEALWHADGPLSLGDKVSLEHPRLGWKQYTAADPASPDNTATVDAREAIVFGIDVNLSAKVSEQVKLKLYRHIPGYYPTADVN